MQNAPDHTVLVVGGVLCFYLDSAQPELSTSRESTGADRPASWLQRN